MQCIFLCNVPYISLVIIISLSFPLYASQPAAASAAEAAGIKSAGQSAQSELAKQLLLNPEKKVLDEEGQAKLITQVGHDAARRVGHHVLSRIEGLVYRYREALLPAVIAVPNTSVLGIRQMVHGRVALTARRYRRIQPAARLIQGKAVMSVAQDADESDDEGNPVNSQLLPLDDYKKLLGRELVANQFVVVGYSDGSDSIGLSPIDLNRLKELSEEQLMFIVSLYGMPDSDNPIILNEKEINIFLSLNAGFRSALKHNYNLVIPPSLEGGEYALKYKQEHEALEKTIKEKTEIAAQVEQYNKELLEARKKLEELKDHIAHPHRVVEQEIEKKKAEYAKKKEEYDAITAQVQENRNDAQACQRLAQKFSEEVRERLQELRRMEDNKSWAACVWQYTSPVLSLIGACTLVLMINQRYRNDSLALAKTWLSQGCRGMKNWIEGKSWLRSYL